MIYTMATAGLPSGTVTFLLTDVEGSTRLWEGHPEVAAVVIPRHRELIGRAVTEWRGGRPLEQGEGDNVVAAFASANDAVSAAHAAQVALAAEAWPDGGTVRVRMALHTGEVAVQSDGTYAGAVLNRCARLRALAHGGQVLVSGATADLAADHLDRNLTLVDLGAHRLRDLSRPERVWQVSGPGLNSEFPPLRSLDATPNNLPVQLSSFIGREDDIVQGVDLLSRSRLLTLTGAGGCGKTRLAQRVAGEVADRFPGGTWWVELAPLGTPDLVAGTVAAAMGIRVAPEQLAEEAIAEQLADFATLLVLDNCEHVVEAAAAFADHVLRASSTATVLATSREPLGIEGEVTWRVPSLAVPPTTGAEPAGLEQYDAVRLFIDRAVQVRPNFRVNNANAPAIAQICHRLDGIPLAIELAAARTRSLPPERIASELDDRFRLLAGGSRVALPRQQTLFASVDWSHELLDPGERSLLRRLAVFAGGFSLDAAEAVAAYPPLDAFEVLEVLGRLVDKSLVQADEDSGGVGRYRLLETIREYALDRLDESGETATARDRALAWVTDFVAGREVAATNAHADALDALDGELANIRVALDWATSAGRIDEALRLVAMLAVFWAGHGHYAEAGAVIPRVLELGAGRPGLARARWAGAYVRFYGGDFLGALEDATTALEEAKTAGDDATTARCLHTLGTAMLPAEPEEARAILEESTALARVVGDDWCEADSQQMSAYAFLGQGLIAQALPLLEASFALAVSARNEFQGAWHHMGLAMIASLSGDVATARREANQSIDLGRRLGDPAVEIFCAAHWGRFLGELGHVDEVQAIVDELASANKEWGLLGGALLPALAAQAAAHDQPGEGSAVLAAVADALGADGALCEANELWMLAAAAALDAGDNDKATRLALLISPKETWPRDWAKAARVRAVVERRTGGEAAEDLAHEALTVFIEVGLVTAAFDVLAVLGGIAIDAGSAAEGTRLLAAADALHQGIDRRRSPAEQRTFDADVTAARTLLLDTFDATWKEGATLTWEDAAAYARRARGERKRPSFGWASLTPTEEQVIHLVVEGLTNPEIAERLMMGRETVKTHLGHIFAKLEVRSRADLASRATERRGQR